MFAYHAKVYPRIMQQLHEALAYAKRHEGDFVEDLQNLVDFYEIYVPTVCPHTSLLITDLTYASRFVITLCI